MRALLLCLIGLMAASPDLALAQMKLSPKAAPGASEVRYFTSIDGLMDGNADVVLKETRQGKTVTAAVLDVCYPAEKGSERKDRFVANLAVSGQNLTGTTQSLGDKLPVTVKLARKPTGDSFEFRGQISVGQTVTEVASTDNSDLSEKEFQDNQTTDDGITRGAEGFYRSVAGIDRRAGEAGCGAGFPEKPEGPGPSRSSLSSLTVSCDALRAGEQTINHHRRSGARRGADRESQVVARRGRRGLDHRHRRDGSHHPFCRRRMARWRQAQQGQARGGDLRRAGEDAGGESWRRRHGTPTPAS